MNEGTAIHDAAWTHPEAFCYATGAPRSPQWAGLRKEIICAQPWCSACGGTENLTVHHLEPFHLRPELELNTANLIVLCEGAAGHAAGLNCHFCFGHRGFSWAEYDRHCVELVAVVRQHLDRLLAHHRGPKFPRPEIQAVAKVLEEGRT